MYKEVYKDIYQINVTLPNNPLKALNSYLIKAGDKSLLIDTGFNRPECREELFQTLEELEVDLDKLDLFITHLHADHSGLAAEFNESAEFIYASKLDGESINDMPNIEHWEKLEKFVLMSGLGEDQVSYRDHPAYKFKISEKVPFTYLEEGDVLDIGDYSFQVVETPGHTQGMIGLYEPKHKLYFSGDHILDIITPNISFWGYETRDLETYLKSLEKIIEYDIDVIFPSHRNLMYDHPRRAREIIEHHQERLAEIEELLSDDYVTVREVTKNMEWRIRAKNWEEFPPAQKWFASGEALSHLEYLHDQGRIDRKIENDLFLYKRK